MSSHPSEFVCPISMSLMRDPVVGTDGHTYERSAITAWLSSNPVSPMTREPMSLSQLKPNYALRASMHTVWIHLLHDPMHYINANIPGHTKSAGSHAANRRVPCMSSHDGGHAMRTLRCCMLVT